MMPRPGAAKSVVPKNGIGIAFWIAGVPGNAVIVKVKAPSAIAGGISRCGTFAWRKSACGHGKYGEGDHEEAHAAVGEQGAGQHHRHHGARLAQRVDVMVRAIESAAPLSSISLPNTAPSRNSGKNCR